MSKPMKKSARVLLILLIVVVLLIACFISVAGFLPKSRRSRPP